MCVVKIKFHLFLISISRLLFDNAFYFIQVKTIIDSNKKMFMINEKFHDNDIM